MKRTEHEVWAIVSKDHGVDGRSAPARSVVKKIYDYEADARDNVFPPFQVEPMTITPTVVLNQLRAKITPEMEYVMKIYKPEAIVAHLLGKEPIG